FPGEEDAKIILIDKNNFLLFTPMLIEVMSNQIDMMDIVTPARQLSHRITFEEGQIETINLQTKEIKIRTGGLGCDAPSVERIIKADHIVIALGSRPNYRGIPGLAENSFTMNNLCDAVLVRNRTLALLERANAEPDIEEKKALLTFVIGGGGFSGVETAAALHDSIIEASQYYPNVEESYISVIIVEALDRLLPELSERLAEYARLKLLKSKIEVCLCTKIAIVTPNMVQLDNGRKINTRTVIWTGGVSPNIADKSLECHCNEKGCIAVNSYMQVPDHDGVWAIGDCASIPMKNGNGFYAPTAQNATREGKAVAKNIHSSIYGCKMKEFDFKPLGGLAALGKRSGVASIMGIHLSGLPAWFLWRAVYLMKLPKLSQKVRVGIDWMVDLIFGREIVQMPADCFMAGICGITDQDDAPPETLTNNSGTCDV
ncbi:MAG: NAD(P)/FAD-dependent oxidoreductase, partial [Armatimonadota bacterium]